MKFNFEKIQQLGRALMLPIALLPVAGILLRFGQPDLLNIKYIADAGNIIFSNLALLFALGIAIGLAKDNNGTSALAACVGYFIMTAILTDINKDINVGVLGGILIGLITAWLYNRYKDINLPSYLAFFGGKRFIPIITGLVAVVIGIILGYIWPPIQNGLNLFGRWLIIDAGAWGVFIYGVLNRMLLVTGLHHILNNLVWFVFGNYTNAMGVVVHGDLTRFMAGDPNAGHFMAGYFPIMMFGLPAACLAMYKNALPENKKAVAGLLLSMALTSFLTGVTEPIEFSFVFLAPLLFVIHAILTGLSLAIMYLLNVHLGFTFSAGLIDYLLFFKLSTNPIYLVPVGLVFFVLYYFIFDFFIRKYNLQTIGRDKTNIAVSVSQVNSRALEFIEALGGASNILAIDSCTTRLRLTTVDSSDINIVKLKTLGAYGAVAPSKDTLQVIVGAVADIIASEIRESLGNKDLVHSVTDVKLSIETKLKPTNILVDDYTSNKAQKIIQALGGKDNFKSFDIVALTRLRVELKDESKFVKDAFADIAGIDIVDISANIKQIYTPDNTESLYWAIVQNISK